MEMILTSFSDCLKYWRKKLGYTQVDFAQKLGTNQTTYSAWEVGIRIPKINMFIKILSVLDLSFDKFYLLKDEKYNNAKFEVECLDFKLKSGKKIRININEFVYSEIQILKDSNKLTAQFK